MFLDGLMPHQAAGVEWLLSRPKAMLAWEMGVGKTATLLRAWENSQDSGPMLVLCLASARENWRREALRFAIDPDLPPRVQVIKTKHEPLDHAADIVVTNYDKLLIKTVPPMLRTRRWGTLALDEAHALKSCDAQRTQLVYGGSKYANTRPLIDHAERVWQATGTPFPNHPAEIWTHAFYNWPEALTYNGHPMELWEFELGFCKIKENSVGKLTVVGGKNLAELKQRLSPYVSRLKRKDVLDLPPLRLDVWPLDAETTGGFRIPDLPDLMDSLIKEYGPPSKIDQFDQATLDAYLASIAAAFSQIATVRNETASLKAVSTVLTLREEFEQDHNAGKTVVFAYHRDAIETLAKGLKDYLPAVIHGGTPHSKRDEEIDRFQTDPTCRVFIGQIKAAGSSINLQAANNVVFVECDWSPGENAQALSRVYRAGQSSPVFVRFMYLPGSIDEAVNRALARKTAMLSELD
jgi:SNF2 family DNA or RNA helicase